MCEYMSNFILLYIQHTLMGPNNITTNKLKMTTYTCLFLVPAVTAPVQGAHQNMIYNKYKILVK